MKRRAFTLIELLVVIGIAILLTSILFPSFKAAKDRGRTFVCISNLRQIGMAIRLYADDNDDTYPPGAYNSKSDRATPQWDTSWSDLILPYLQKRTEILYCPMSSLPPSDMRSSYGANPWVLLYTGATAVGAVTSPPSVVCVADHSTPDWCVCPWSWRDSPSHAYLTPRHQGKVDVLWLDGHVTGVNPQALEPISEHWRPY